MIISLATLIFSHFQEPVGLRHYNFHHTVACTLQTLLRVDLFGISPTKRIQIQNHESNNSIFEQEQLTCELEQKKSHVKVSHVSCLWLAPTCPNFVPN